MSQEAMRRYVLITQILLEQVILQLTDLPQPMEYISDGCFDIRHHRLQSARKEGKTKPKSEFIK